MSERILVLGGTGFIGRNLVLSLVKSDFIVSVLSLNLPVDEKKSKGLNIGVPISLTLNN